MLVLGIICLAWLAFENGGNDVSRSISTLISGGIMNYRKAIIAGSIATLIGAIISAWTGTQIVKLFSLGLLQGSEFPPSLAVAALIAAPLWITISTKLSMPVSTTHSITGGIIGAAVVSIGADHVKWTALTGSVLAPLLISPVLSIIIAYLLWFIIMKLPEGNYLRSMHFISAMFVAVARAINDTPKIVGIGFLMAMTTGLDTSSMTSLFFIAAIAMTLGSYIKGLPVTRLLAEKITKMDDREALGVNLTTALLISTASKLGLPVASVQVVSSAIIGFGLRKGPGGISWKVVRDMVSSWIVTLPAAAVFGAIICLMIK